MIYRVFLEHYFLGEYFREVCHFCSLEKGTLYKFVIFALGFYTSQIYKRWWDVYTMIPWPDRITFELGSYMLGPKGNRRVRRKRLQQVVRYLSLGYIMVFRDFSERIRKRFPTIGHLEDLLTREEMEKLHGTEQKTEIEKAQWMPFEWICQLLKESYQQNLIHDVHFTNAIGSILEYRERLHNLLQYDTVNLPLSYTQAVHLVTYGFLALQLFAYQNIASCRYQYCIEQHPLSLYALFNVLFLLGWLKLAEALINPFGNDDDDFDVDLFIERNFEMTNAIVEQFYVRAPRQEELNFDIKMPEITVDTQIEDFLRGISPLQGSAVPENKELKRYQYTSLTPEVERNLDIPFYSEPSIEPLKAVEIMRAPRITKEEMLKSKRCDNGRKSNDKKKAVNKRTRSVSKVATKKTQESTPQASEEQRGQDSDKSQKEKKKSRPPVNPLSIPSMNVKSTQASTTRTNPTPLSRRSKR